LFPGISFFEEANVHASNKKDKTNPFPKLDYWQYYWQKRMAFYKKQ